LFCFVLTSFIFHLHFVTENFRYLQKKAIVTNEVIPKTFIGRKKSREKLSHGIFY